jgi:hypothetical protein
MINKIKNKLMRSTNYKEIKKNLIYYYSNKNKLDKLIELSSKP